MSIFVVPFSVSASEMTYIVSGGALNSTNSNLTQLLSQWSCCKCMGWSTYWCWFYNLNSI